MHLAMQNGEVHGRAATWASIVGTKKAWIKDGLVTNLAEKSESGITPTGSTAKSWVSLPAAVAWGVAAIVLRTVSIITVFARQLTETVDEFLRSLAEESV